MNKNEYLDSQQDCASLIGETIEEYQESLKTIKRNIFKENYPKEDQEILDKLGLLPSDLKKKEKEQNE